MCVFVVPFKGFSCFSGDIRDLFNIKLKPGHAAAFATDCDLPSTHEMVRSIGMQVDFYILYHITFCIILPVCSDNALGFCPGGNTVMDLVQK